jgi:hypothetical protein
VSFVDRGAPRHGLFASLEPLRCLALPATDYEFAEWRLARVRLNFHVEPKCVSISEMVSLLRIDELSV